MHLVNCKLESLPEWNDMGALTYVDVSGNRLTSVPRSASIISMNLMGNEMKTLCLRKKEFQSLTHVKAGSKYLQYIAFETLKYITVDIPEKHRYSLILPPAIVLSKGNQLRRYLLKPAKYLIHVGLSKLDEAIQWLANDADFPFNTLDLSKQTYFFSNIFDMGRFHTFFMGDNLTALKELNVSSCKLTTALQLEYLEKLETLIMGNNGLMDLASLTQPNLRKLDVTNNPIVTISVDFNRCPLVSEIKAGSKDTKYLSLSILERISAGDLTVDLSKFKNDLLYPPSRTVPSDLDKNLVKAFLLSGMFDVSWFIAEDSSSCDSLTDVKNILSIDERIITTFKMCNFPQLFKNNESALDSLFESPRLSKVECLELRKCNLSSVPLLRHALKLHKLNISENEQLELTKQTYESLSNISALILRRCKLKELPNSCELENLVELDVGDNEIKSLDFDGIFPNMKTLSVDENPIVTLTFRKKEKLPRLQSLTCGSDHLKFIGFEVLEDTLCSEEMNEALKITLVNDKQLIMPPYRDILENDDEKRKYLNNPGIYLQHDKHQHVEIRFEALTWLLAAKDSFKTFSLAGQADLRTIDKFNLDNILESECLHEITLLDLSRLELSICPNLSHVEKLERLILEGNKISNLKEIDKESLVELNVVDNPIKEIHWEDDAFKNLDSIHIGSPETKFISHAVLERKINNNLDIKVAEKYRSNLMCPPYTYFTTPGKLQLYFKNPETVLADLQTEFGDTVTLGVLKWIIGKSHHNFESLDLSKRAELFLGETYDKTMKFLGKNKLSNLSQLCLQSCGLTFIPILDNLPSLEELDLSFNLITESSKLLQLPKLKQLNLTGNEIKCVDLNLNSFKVLKELYCGSKLTKFVSFNLVEAQIEKNINIVIDKDYESNLLFPPSGYLKAENKALLKEYYHYPETKLSCIGNVTDRHEALEWILKREKSLFSTSFSLSDQGELVAHLGIEQIESTLAMTELSGITELHLDGCGLTTVPKVCTMTRLELLDIRNNELEQVEVSANLMFNSLKEINLTGNLIEVLDFNIENMDKLELIKFGSTVTKYVRLSFLNILLSKNIQIVPDEGHDEVVFPPYKFLKRTEENHAKLAELIDKPEKGLMHVPDVKTKFELLKWLSEDKALGQTVDFTGESDLLDYRPFSNMKFDRIETLNLSSCDLNKCPNLALYPGLKTLYLKNNLIKEWTPQPKHENLEKLDISGNSIQIINDNFTCFPSLNHLTIGSKETKYISIKLLERTEGFQDFQRSEVVQNTPLRTLVIEVNNLYIKHLLLPRYNVIKADSETRLSYLQSPDTFLHKISDISKRKNALQWLVKDFGEKLESFSLRGQKDLCERLTVIELEQILSSLPSLKELDLSKCGLKETPDISFLLDLKSLDLSVNDIDKFSQSFSHSELARLSIHGNPIRTVDTENFCSLIELECGWDKNWRIDPRTLSRMYNEKVKLKIKIQDAYQNFLEFPPYEKFKDGPAAIENFLNKEELDLSEIKRVDDDMEIYILEVKNAENRFKSIRVSDVGFLPKLLETNSAFTTLIHDKNIQEKIERLRIQNCNITEFPQSIMLPNLKEVILSNNKLKGNFENLPKRLEILKVRNCGLQTLPKIVGLKVLDIGNNNLTSTSTDSKYSSLIELLIDGNPIHCISFDNSTFPRLQTLTLGSPEMHYISQKVLELNISIIIPLQYRKSLLLPTYEGIQDLDNYLRTPERYISEDDTESLNWLMEDRKGDIKEFNLFKLQKLCMKLGMGGLNQLLNDPKLISLSALRLDNCGLDSIPDIQHFGNIEILSVAKNNITSINVTSQTIHTLNIEGNPIEKIDFNFSRLPSLTKIACGSTKTKEISRSILEQVAEGQVQVVVSLPYQSVLITPPINVLNGSKTFLQTYLKTCDTNLSKVDLSRGVVFGKLSILEANAIINNKTSIQSLKLSRQEYMFITKDAVYSFLQNKKLKGLQELHMDKCNLEEIPNVRHLNHLNYLDVSNNSVTNWYLRTSLNLPHLSTLVLRNTGLDRLPSLTYLPRLKDLDFSKNKLTNMIPVFHEKMKTPHPLESLDVSGNIIEKISFSRTIFPSLKKITCGSCSTRFLSFSLMEAVIEGHTEVNVPDDYNEYLLVPVVSQLYDPSDSLAKFINNTSVNLSEAEISNIHNRNKAFEYLFATKTNFYKTLDLTGQDDFCLGKLLSPLLAKPSLNSISSLCLVRCRLNSFPLPINSLPYLILLDVSRNNIKELTTLISHERLQSLYIGSNPIERINIEKMKNYPKLSFIQAGHKDTKSIGASILEAVKSGKLTIDIIKEHRKHLSCPPYEILKGGAKLLAVYMKEAELSTRNKTNEMRKVTKNVVLYLGNSMHAKEILKGALEGQLAENTSTLKTGLIKTQSLSIFTIDFGDHHSHEFEVELLREWNKIALIVIDLKMYEEKNHDDLVTKWLYSSIIYSDCKVIVAPITRERVLPENVDTKIESLRKHILNWKTDQINFLKKIKKPDIEHGIDVLPTVATACKEKVEQIDNSIKFFETLEVIIIPTNSVEVKGFDDLKAEIRKVVDIGRVLLPVMWDKVLSIVQQKEKECKYYTTIAEIKFPIEKQLQSKSSGFVGFLKEVFTGDDGSRKLEESIEGCLQYLNKKGIILWYDQKTDYLLHNIVNIFELQKELFREDISDVICQKLDYRDGYRFDRKKIEETGCLSRDLLQVLWSSFSLSTEELERMVELLKVKYLCYEEKLRDPDNPEVLLGSLLKMSMFINTPYLDKRFREDNWPDNLSDEYLEFNFIYKFYGRPPPSLTTKIIVGIGYVFSKQPFEKKREWANGIYMQLPIRETSKKLKLLIERHTDISNSKLIAKFRAHHSDLFDLWKLCLNIYNIVSKFAEISTVITYDKVYICPHCILAGYSSDSAYKLSLDQVVVSRCGQNLTTSCPNDVHGAEIPAAFHQPILKG